MKSLFNYFLTLATNISSIINDTTTPIINGIFPFMNSLVKSPNIVKITASINNTNGTHATKLITNLLPGTLYTLSVVFVFLSFKKAKNNGIYPTNNVIKLAIGILQIQLFRKSKYYKIFRTDHIKVLIHDNNFKNWCIDGEKLEDKPQKYDIKVLKKIKCKVSKNAKNYV